MMVLLLSGIPRLVDSWTVAKYGNKLFIWRSLPRESTYFHVCLEMGLSIFGIRRLASSYPESSKATPILPPRSPSPPLASNLPHLHLMEPSVSGTLNLELK